MIYDKLDEARDAHKVSGGFLLDFGGVYMVTDDLPCEHRSFDSTREIMEYSFQLAEANYDETRIGEVTDVNVWSEQHPDGSEAWYYSAWCSGHHDHNGDVPSDEPDAVAWAQREYPDATVKEVERT